VFRFPERFFPHKFDLLGSSHQIFHVAVVLGCLIHVNASFKLFLARKEMICPIDVPN